MQVLVTGGAGFIGSHLVRLMLPNASVRVLDNLRTGHEKNLKGLDVEFINGSIVDSNVVREVMRGVDLVFHLAAFVSVPESVEDPQECAQINVLGLLNVLQAAADAGVRKLCFCSSAAVYGNSPETPKVEWMSPDPRSPYAVTKLDGEFYCRQFTAEKRLETVSLRFFNVFGPRQDPNGPYGAAIPVFFQRAFAGLPLTIHGDGRQTRDFIYVNDIVSALMFAGTTPGLTGVFNAGYGQGTAIIDLAKRICSIVGSSSSIVHAPPRAGDVRHSVASVARLSDAGFKPEGDLDRGLRRTFDDLVQSGAGRSRTYERVQRNNNRSEGP